MDFSLFYFAASEADDLGNKYELLLEGAKFADQHNLKAVWVPERHFASFGDPFPNPSVAAAAVAAVTHRVKIRSGSVVLPLHDPIRIAEEWSMVDHLSQGRVELSIASGWHPNDFVLAPNNFEQRQQKMRDNLGIIQNLWQGQSIVRPNGVGEDFELFLRPKPMQKKLPIWVTSSGNIETFKYAASMGASVLTHMLGQEIRDLKEKIKIYRDTLVENGFDRKHGSVAIMLHTFVGNGLKYVKKTVEAPFKNYLVHSGTLAKSMLKDKGEKMEQYQDRLLQIAFTRHFKASGLFGTPESCLARVHELQAIEVDEVACLIDFGIDTKTTLTNFRYLAQLQGLVQKQDRSVPTVSKSKTPSAEEITKKKKQEERVKFMKEKIRKAPRFPLSYAQERIWTLYQEHPDFSKNYHLTNSFILKGALNASVLEIAFNRILERHSVLRSFFIEEQQRPIQVLTPFYKLKIFQKDARALNETQIRNALLEESHRPFRISREIPLRVNLFMTGEDTYLLSLTMHQLVFDGGSWHPLIQELGEFYEHLLAKKTLSLPPIPLQYGEYAKWQRDTSEAQLFAKQLDYWQQRFTPPPPQLEMPSDIPDSWEITGTGAVHSFDFTDALAEAFMQFCKDKQHSMFVVLVSVFQTLLSLYSKQNDVLVFFSTSGRKQPELKDMIGLFANLVPLLIKIPATMPFVELLEQGRNRFYEAIENQDLPFAKMTEVLRISHENKSSNRVNLFQAMVVFHNDSIPLLKFPSFSLEPKYFDEKTAQFDLLLVVRKAGTRFQGQIQYKSDLFTAETIDQISENFLALLNLFIASPELSLNTEFFQELELAKQIETHRRQLLEKRKQFEATHKEQYAERPYEAPQTEEEKTIASIWKKEMNLKIISRHDNFFELGGHSIAAVRTVSKIESAFDVKLELVTLFQNPTIHQLAESIQSVQGPQQIALTPADRSQPLRLSFAQQRLWFIDQIESTGTQYNKYIYFKLEGTLDKTVFKKTVQAIINRHEVLRTNFIETDGTVFQVIQDHVEAPLREIDLSGLPMDEQAIQLDQLLEDDMTNPYDLAKDVFLRVHLIQCSPTVHRVLFSMHDIASDGWSMGVLVKEFNALYTAFYQDVSNPLPPLTIQYADYAQWQRTSLHGEFLESQIAYWKKQLEGIPPVHKFPLDRTRPAEQTFEGKCTRTSIDRDLTQKIYQFCQSNGVTLFMFLQSAFSVLLGRYSNETDIVIGSPIAGRNHREVEPLIGCFINTLVLRSDLSIDSNGSTGSSESSVESQSNPFLSFKTLLKRNQQTILDAYTHQHVPFEVLVESLQPVRSLSHSPLFQVMLLLQNNERNELQLPSLTMKAEDFKNNLVKFDLELSVMELESRLELEWDRKTALFYDDSIQRLATNFEVLLRGVLEQPEQDIQQLPLLTEKEKHRLLTEFQNTHLCQTSQTKPVRSTEAWPNGGKATTIHEMFEIQVAHTPDAMAVLYESQSLSYSQLNERANQLAHCLKEHGVTTDTPVGICMDRSLAMVVGIFGILKAGGAYLPLDPSYPSSRIEYMLHNSKVEIIISQKEMANLFPADQKQVILLDSALTQAKLDNYSSENPTNLTNSMGGSRTPPTKAVDSSHENPLAYVIYTSGSTGMPKGVMVEHSALVNRSLWVQARYGFTPNDKILQKTPFSFDVSIWEFFSTLTAGACLVMAKPEGHKDPDYLYGLIRQVGITALHFVPSMLSHFLHQVDWAQCDSVRQVFCIGEALPKSVVKEFYETGTRSSLHNLYGPTEATVIVSYWDCQDYENYESIPIGQPVSGVQLHVLNEALQLAPIGAIGELYIGGSGLARGYIHQKELTDEKFIPSPFNPKERLYRTGDLARWTPSAEPQQGVLEFLGRVDHQVKIRGFRIELGEIEAQLIRLREIKEAAVLMDDSETRLIAYFVLDQATASAVSNVLEGDERIAQIKEQLKIHLPDYMVPSIFMLMDVLPQTSNGKLDRKALPTPESGNFLKTQYVGPRNEMEEKLCRIWQEVLSLEPNEGSVQTNGPIGIHDNFFDMGGHSLLATRLISAIRKELEVELPVLTLFEEPTIAELSEKLEGLKSDFMIPPIKRLEDRTKLPLSFAQQRLWFIDQLEGESTEYNEPWAFKLEGKLNKGAFTKAIHTIIERHEVLRSNFIENNGLVSLTIKEKVLSTDLFVSEVDLTHLDPSAQEGRIKSLGKEDETFVFQLEKDLLMRVRLLILSPEAHVILFNIHYIISDGWSIGVWAREFCNLYQAFAEGKESSIPPLKAQYADYAQWQQDWLQGEVLNQQMDYWKNQLSGIPAVHRLPLDKPRQAHQKFIGKTFEYRLNGALNEPINELCKARGVTLFMLLQTTFSLLLSRYSNDVEHQVCDVVMGSPIAGRYHKDLEPLIGLFVNTMVLRTKVSSHQCFLELLENNKQMILDVFTHQHLPFEMLVEALQPERTLSYSPIFQIMFDLQNNEQSEIKMPGLVLTSLQQEQSAVKFDLRLSIHEIDGKLIGNWSYNTGLFYEESIQRMAANFEVLLENVIKAPQQNVATIPIFSEREKQYLLNGCQDARPYDTEQGLKQESKVQSLHERFEAQVLKTPHAIAVAAEDEHLTYRQLNDQASRLAHYLVDQREKSKSSQLGVLVGLCVERSLAMMVGLLGILKSGAAYVPLDPEYPKKRIENMCRNSQVEFVVTQSRLSHLFPTGLLSLVLLDDEKTKAQLKSRDTENRSPLEDEHQLAYVIYTSGTTGQPKGVMVEHKGVIDYCTAALAGYYSDSLKGALLSTGLSFDATVPCLFLPLFSGGTVRMTPQDETIDLFWKQILRLDSAYLIKLTPSHIRGSVGNEGITSTQAHRFVVGGEPLTKFHVQALKTLFPQAMIFNQYGPTEAIVGCSLFEVSELKNLIEESIPIGRPLGNFRFYVLNQFGQLVPKGAVGELHVGCSTLARGYLKDTVLTQEKFISNPFLDSNHSTSESQMYKTGDLVRWLPNVDGQAANLKFIGRADRQVKVRGFRVELGEIETGLIRSENIQEVVVLAQEGADGEKQPVAYLTLNQHLKEKEQSASKDNPQPWSPLLEELKRELKLHLPEYMIPTFFIVVPEFPLSPNGKVDRAAFSRAAFSRAAFSRAALHHKALPAPGEGDLPKNTYVAPRTNLEQKMGVIWQDLLKVESVGIADSFFDLGGHSLMATRLISLIRQQLEVDLSLRDLFEYPTIAGLSDHLKLGQGSALPAIERVERHSNLILSYAQQRLWVIDQFEPDSLHYNIRVTLKLDGDLNQDALIQALSTIVQRHEVLRTVYEDDDGVPFQVIQEARAFDLPISDLCHLQGQTQQDEVDRLMRAEADRPFALDEDLMLRAQLLVLSDHSSILLVTMHHIASDGWSLGILINELSTLYQAFAQGVPANLPALPVQYADYAHWQRNRLRDDVLQKQLAYWKNELEGIPAVHSLPLDHPRPEEQSYRGTFYRHTLNLDLKNGLNQLAKHHGATLFMVIHTAFSCLLAKVSGASDIVMGTSVANREQPEIELLVGFFVNNLVLRLDCSGEPQFSELLAQSKERALGAYEHQQLPFDRLVDHLKPERSLGYNPLFQILLQFQNIGRDELELPNLQLTVLDSVSLSSQFDLALNVNEGKTGLNLNWNYALDLFESETIERLSQSFEVLLQAVVDDSEIGFGELSIET